MSCDLESDLGSTAWIGRRYPTTQLKLLTTDSEFIHQYRFKTSRPAHYYGFKREVKQLVTVTRSYPLIRSQRRVTSFLNLAYF